MPLYTSSAIGSPHLPAYKDDSNRQLGQLDQLQVALEVKINKVRVRDGRSRVKQCLSTVASVERD
jgi:hypothetical protein